MQEESTVFGRVIKKARTSAGFTREVFSERIGKSPRYIAAIENEGQTPSYETLCSIITNLGIDANIIFYPDAENNNTELDRIIRQLKLCDEHQLSIISAALDAMLN